MKNRDNAFKFDLGIVSIFISSFAILSNSFLKPLVDIWVGQCYLTVQKPLHFHAVLIRFLKNSFGFSGDAPIKTSINKRPLNVGASGGQRNHKSIVSSTQRKGGTTATKYKKNGQTYWRQIITYGRGPDGKLLKKEFLGKIKKPQKNIFETYFR